MKKVEFLAILRLKLSKLHPVEQEMMVSMYEDAIDKLIKQGVSETEAVAKQGDVTTIANMVLQDIGVSKKNKNNAKKFKSVAMFVLGIVIIYAGFGVLKANQKIMDKRNQARLAAEAESTEESAAISINSHADRANYKLSDGNMAYDERAIVSTKEIIKLIDKKNYDHLIFKYVTPDMEEFFTDEHLGNELKEAVGDSGKFVDFMKTYTSIIQKGNTRLVACECVCVYEKTTIIYMVVFDPSYKILEFSVR